MRMHSNQKGALTAICLALEELSCRCILFAPANHVKDFSENKKQKN